MGSVGSLLPRISIEKNVVPFSTCSSSCLSLYQHVVSPSPVSPSLFFCAHIALYEPAIAAVNCMTFKCTLWSPDPVYSQNDDPPGDCFPSGPLTGSPSAAAASSFVSSVQARPVAGAGVCV